MTSRGAWQKLVSEKEIFPKSVSELSQQQNCQMTTQIRHLFDRSPSLRKLINRNNPFLPLAIFTGPLYRQIVNYKQFIHILVGIRQLIVFIA
jgi:hypothetical protein